ncbi:MAG: alpha/beta hydrolase-fold protein [Verrucomicrobiota bacterium]
MKLEEHSVSSRDGAYTRKVWMRPGPVDRVHPLAIFLDAEYYLRDMDSPQMLEGLMESSAIPELTILFVSHVDVPARVENFTCNPRYASFIAEDLFGWAREQNASIQASNNLISGLSLSGLQGVFTALSYPQKFSYCLAQSGSFWWEDCRLIGEIANYAASGQRYWLSVGDEEVATHIDRPQIGLYQEVSQIEGVTRTADALRTIGAEVSYHLFKGGHAPAPWSDDLPKGMQWLFGSNN